MKSLLPSLCGWWSQASPYKGQPRLAQGLARTSLSQPRLSPVAKRAEKRERENSAAKKKQRREREREFAPAKAEERERICASQ